MLTSISLQIKSWQIKKKDKVKKKRNNKEKIEGEQINKDTDQNNEELINRQSGTEKATVKIKKENKGINQEKEF